MIVIPAQAGIQMRKPRRERRHVSSLDSRLRGNDGMSGRALPLQPRFVNPRNRR